MGQGSLTSSFWNPAMNRRTQSLVTSHTLDAALRYRAVFALLGDRWRTGIRVLEVGSGSGGAAEWTDAEIIGVSVDSPFAQEAWAKKESINVTLLSDYEHKVAQSYGVSYESFLPQLNLGFAGVAKRSAFLIDREGVIRYAEIHDDARELPDFDQIKTRPE